MNYSKIAFNSTHSGPGIRTVLYVSGCRNCCPDCQNPETWCFGAGKLFTEQQIWEILESLNKPWVAGLTLCGGEPMEPENQIGLLPLLLQVRAKLPDKPIWCYTGYELTDLLPGGKKHLDEFTSDFLELIDVLITGRFIGDQKDITNNNLWRGSRNQRVLKLKESLAQGKPIPLENIPNNEI